MTAAMPPKMPRTESLDDREPDWDAEHRLVDPDPLDGDYLDALLRDEGPQVTERTAPVHHSTVEKDLSTGGNPPVEPTADDLDRYGVVSWPEIFAGDVPAVEYVVPEIIPLGSSVACYSDPGAGKSLLFLDLAVRVAMGRPCLGEPTSRRRVLYVDHEQDRGLLRERLESLGCDATTDLSWLHYSLLGDWPPLDSPEGGQALVSVATHLGVQLIIVDTLSRAVAGEENSNDTYLSLYRHTVVRLKRAGIAMVRLDHAGKDPTKGQRGGSAKASDVDLVYRLTAAGADVTLRREKNRLHLPGPDLLAIRRTGEPLEHHRQTLDVRREERILQLIDQLDQMGIAVDAGRPTASKSLRTAGVKVQNEILAAALHRRRLRGQDTPLSPPIGGETEGTVSPDLAGDSRGQRGDSAGTATDSQTHMWGQDPDEHLSPRNGDRS